MRKLHVRRDATGSSVHARHRCPPRRRWRRTRPASMYSGFYGHAAAWCTLSLRPLASAALRQRLVSGVTLVVERVVRVVGPDARHLARARRIWATSSMWPFVSSGSMPSLTQMTFSHAQVLLQLLVAVRAHAPRTRARSRSRRAAARIEQAHVGGDARCPRRPRGWSRPRGRSFRGGSDRQPLDLGHLEGDLTASWSHGKYRPSDQPAAGVEVPVHGALVAVVVDHAAWRRQSRTHASSVVISTTVTFSSSSNTALRVGVVHLVHAHGDGLELGDSARHVGVLPSEPASRRQAPRCRCGAATAIQMRVCGSNSPGMR